MDTINKIHVLSFSGLSRVAIEIIKNNYPNKFITIFDDNVNASNQVQGNLAEAFKSKGGFYYFNGLGNYNHYKTRIILSNQMQKIGTQGINVIHSTAYCSVSSKLSTGLFMGANSSIGVNTEVGIDTVIFSNSTIEHDTKIGNLCYISPGVTICGKVKIGDCCYIGPGVVIGAGVEIGNNTIIGAGSVVLKNLTSNKIVMGTPAQIVKENNLW